MEYLSMDLWIINLDRLTKLSKRNKEQLAMYVVGLPRPLLDQSHDSAIQTKKVNPSTWALTPLLPPSVAQRISLIFFFWHA